MEKIATVPEGTIIERVGMDGITIRNPTGEKKIIIMADGRIVALPPFKTVTAQG